MTGDALVVASVFAAALLLGKMRENGALDAAFAAIERQAAILGDRAPAIGSTFGPAIGTSDPGVRLASRWSALPLCGQGKRVTCLVDGDTGWAGGTKWRLLNIDAPEVSRPECPREKIVANQATRRLQALLATGYDLDGDGYDRYRRELVTITLSDGRDAGSVLIAEGLAQPWPNSGNPWCGR
ncbi:thermonuclease family protein [Jiella pelagia]|uniref:Thermonuclease family protein n=1 Tax=Jiella pelagia TaxID=2986949 RepID=A0ABY7BUV1_9HYPH|nr:thermonuclease family protein [Jiella pelagia]WAP67574.1 thermonuclease family protein [Jiella pelagia]